MGRVGALIIAASVVLAACQPSETATPDIAPPMVTPLATVETSPTAPADSEATDLATDASSFVWPLAADLYYLTDQGQVYRQPYQSPDLAPVMITSPDIVVSDFALAPGDEWLLVRVDGTITAVSLAGKGGQEIATGTGTPQDTSRGQTMDWSADGTKIAYTSPDGFQIYVSAGAGLQPYIYAIPTPDAAMIDVRWSLDSSRVAAWTSDHEGLVCDVSDVTALQCQNIDELIEVTFDNPHLIDVPVEGGAWDASHSRIVVPAKDVSGLDFFTPDGAGGSEQVATAGLVKQLAWGEPPPAKVSSVPMPNALYFIAPYAGLQQVWRLAPGADSPEPITRALADVAVFDVSLDGTKITYTSGGAIFVQTIGANDARQIVALPPDAHSPTGTPSFSPTGRRVLFANNGLFVYDTQTDRTFRLIPDSEPAVPAENQRWYDQPRYSPDSNWIMARRRTTAGADIVVLPSGGAGINATPLNQPGGRAEWTSDSKIVVYSDGSTFGLGQVNRFPAFRPGAPDVIFAATAIDIQERIDGRMVVLQTPFALPFGPATVRLFSFLPDGSDAQPETGSLVVESPVLSTNGVLVAGLIQTQVLGDGTVVGQLVLINPATQDVFLIDGMTHVHGLMWGK